MWRASAAYSSGWPRRLGNGIWRPSSARASSGSAASSGVSKRPGSDRHHADAAAREVARGGQRQADDAALRGRVGDLADLAVEGGDRGRVDADAALALVVGLVVDHRGAARRSTLKVPIRLTLITLWKISRSCGPACRRCAAPSRSPRSRPRSAARRRRRRGSTAACTCSGSMTFASTKLARSPSSRGQRLALLGVEVGDHDATRRRACRARAVAAPSPEAPPATSALAPSIFTARQHILAGRRRRRGAAWTNSVACSSSRRRLSSAPGTRSPTGWRRRGSARSSWSSRSTDEELNRVYSPILSPLAWDLGHIANFEELWLVQTHRRPRAAPRRARPLLRRDRESARDAERAADPARRRAALLPGGRPRADARRARRGRPRVRRGPAARRRLRLRAAARPRAPAHRDDAAADADGRRLRARRGGGAAAPDPSRSARAPRWCSSKGGTVEIGAGAEGFAYDNERPRHSGRARRLPGSTGRR